MASLCFAGIWTLLGLACEWSEFEQKKLWKKIYEKKYFLGNFFLRQNFFVYKKNMFYEKNIFYEKKYCLQKKILFTKKYIFYKKIFRQKSFLHSLRK